MQPTNRLLSNKEMAAQVRRYPKCWLGKSKKSTFYMHLKRIEEGTCREDTVEAFAQRYGYVGTLNAWIKQQ